MRRTPVLSAAVLLGSLFLVPSSALATDHVEDPGHVAPDNSVVDPGRWIGVEEAFAIVLPNGETFTGDEEPTGEQGPEGDVAPVGSRLFLSEVLYATEGGDTRGEQLGRTHIECTAQVVPNDFRCHIVWVFDDTESQLHGIANVNFDTQSETEPLHFAIAVTGGTGEYFGASGEIWLLDITTDPQAETLNLYEASLVLHGVK